MKEHVNKFHKIINLQRDSECKVIYSEGVKQYDRLCVSVAGREASGSAVVGQSDVTVWRAPSGRQLSALKLSSREGMRVNSYTQYLNRGSPESLWWAEHYHATENTALHWHNTTLEALHLNSLHNTINPVMRWCEAASNGGLLLALTCNSLILLTVPCVVL